MNANLLLLTLPLLFYVGCDASSVSADLDSTFGSNGKITTDFFSAEDKANAIAIQSDGKIVVAGVAYNGADADFAIARYETSGMLDTSFASTGKVTTNISANDEARSLAIQSDGKIVVAGTTSTTTASQIAVARYNTDGSLDTTFSGDGKVITLISLTHDEANGVVIQTDGKVVVGGSTKTGSNFDFALVRYDTAGTLDTTFSADGKVTTPMGTGEDRGASLSYRSDGTLLLAGSSKNGTTNDYALARYLTTGALDTSFGSTGKVISNFLTSPTSSDESIFAVGRQADGKVVAAGFLNAGATDLILLARYTTAGLLDTTFGSNGKATVSFTDTSGTYNAQGRAIALESNGGMYLAGFVAPDAGFDFSLTHFDAEGTVDPGFGDSGTITTDVAAQADEALGVVLQSDGKILVAGRAFNGSNYDFALTRYNP